MIGNGKKNVYMNSKGVLIKTEEKRKLMGFQNDDGACWNESNN